MKNKKRIYGLVAGLVVVALVVFSCQKELSGADPDQPHAVRIFLTDHDTPLFDSVFVDLQGLEVKVEDDSLSNGGWVDLSIRPGIYNILRFRNGIDTLFATGILPNARLRKLRLTLGTQNSAMKDGQSFPLRINDDDRQVVVDLPSGSFEVNAGQVIFWIDFDASRSIQVDNSGPGNNNGFRLRSHLRIFAQGNTGRIEGRVLPEEADALVMAIMGTDTTMAVPDDDDGEFKIVGLNAGTYRLFIDGQNSYSDTTINNIIVRNREDTHLSTIFLHR